MLVLLVNMVQYASCTVQYTVFTSVKKRAKEEKKRSFPAIINAIYEAIKSIIALFMYFFIYNVFVIDS